MAKKQAKKQPARKTTTKRVTKKEASEKQKEPSRNGEKTGRDEMTGQFVEGNNFGLGRPKGSRNITTLLREKLEEVDPKCGMRYIDILIQQILQAALIEKNTKIIELIWNYVDGKPPQSLDVTSNGKSFFDELQERQKKFALINENEKKENE